VLSSYVPGGTGRLNPPRDSAVGRARAALAAHGRVKAVQAPSPPRAGTWAAADDAAAADTRASPNHPAASRSSSNSSGGSSSSSSHSAAAAVVAVDWPTEKVESPLGSGRRAVESVAQPPPSGWRQQTAVAAAAELMDGGLSANWPTLDARTVRLYAKGSILEEKFLVWLFCYREPLPARFSSLCTPLIIDRPLIFAP
jgi:hypothetical protein